MALKTFNPTTPSQRHLVIVDRSELWKGKPVKALVEGKRKTGGRNNKGHVTSRGIAGGHKQKYRFVDFKRRKWDVPAIVERLEYDPNRTAFIALIKYKDGERRYILHPHGLAVGEEVLSGEKVEPRAIKRTMLLTVEGEKDDICAVGQTLAAQELCSGIRPYRKRHHMQPGVGHYGVFSGKKWEAQIYPLLKNVILSSD